MILDPPPLTLLEANLPDGSDPENSALTQSGTFTVTAPDGLQTLTVGGAPVVNGGSVVATLPTITTGAGNELEIVSFSDNLDGTYSVGYSYTLNKNKFHEQPFDDDSLAQDFAVFAEDIDGDSATGTLTVVIIDDVPTVLVGAAEDAEVPALETLDTGSDDAGDFSVLFTKDVEAGADGLANESTVYGLSVSVAETGLTSGGKPITVAVDVSGQVVGSTDDGAVFTIGVDAAGNVQVSQLAAIDHVGELDDGDATSNSANKAILSDGNVLLTKTVTVTDGDDDEASDSATVDISSAFSFIDDVPVGGETAVQLNDETASNTFGPPNLGGEGDQPAANQVGFLDFSFGADGAGTVLLSGVTLPDDGGFSSDLSEDKTVLVISQDQNGTPVDVIKVTLADTSSGGYSVEQLNPVFHPTSGAVEENLDFAVEYEVTDGDGDQAQGTLSIRVNDDTPVSVENVNAVKVQVPVVDAQIGGLAAGWKGPFDGNVIGNPTIGDGVFDTDDDDYFEIIAWGRGNNTSNYQFTDNDGLRGEGSLVSLGEVVVVGTFAHNNFPIASGSSISTGVNLKVDLVIEVDGVSVEVNDWEIFFNHWETPNAAPHGGAPSADDGVLIKAPELQVTVRVGEVDYTAAVVGFTDGDDLIQPVGEGSPYLGLTWPNGQEVEVGDIVLWTKENEANFFDLVARVDAAVDYVPSVSGQVEANYGADGPAATDALVWSGVSGGRVEGVFGILTVDDEGNYVYEVSEGVRDSLSKGEHLQDTFTYTVTDGDGDSAESTLVINVHGMGAADQLLVGTREDDVLEGGDGDDILYGIGGNNILVGGAGDDLLIGGDGDDILIGGDGDDTLIGGGGADVFVFKDGDEGTNVVKDFSGAEGEEDTLDFSDVVGNGGTFEEVDDDSPNTTIEARNEGGTKTQSVVVENADVNAADFVPPLDTGGDP